MIMKEVCYIKVFLFKKDLAWFRIRTWEKGGGLWDQLFSVKKWKKHLIDGSSIVKQSYNKRNLHGTKKHQLAHFAQKQSAQN